MSTVIDPDAPFQLRSLLSEAGTASNGERLVQTLNYHYSPELRAALLKRENAALAESLDGAAVARLIGLDPDDPDLELACTVRGGDRRRADAWVTYAYHDARGELWKGAFPYVDLESGSTDRLLTQQASLAQSPAARDYEEEQGKARAAQTTDDVRSLKRQVATLQSRLNAEPATAAEPVETGDPFAALADAKAEELIARMEAHPEIAPGIKAFEQAQRGDKARKSVLEWEPAPTGDSGS